MSQNRTKKIIRYVGRMLYPPTCPLCRRVLDIDNVGTCEECRGLISYVQKPSCLKCGKEIADDEAEFCEDCTNYERTYIKGFPAMNYIGDIKKCVAAFKYNNRRDLSDFFANEIIRCCGRDILDAAPEALVPIPIHRSKLKKRGYNQAELLAKSLGDRLGIPVDSKLIIRSANTLPQKKLDNEEREKNLKKAFISGSEIVKYKRVMLVDDIYTTGATVETCTKVLMKKGVTEVYYTSICIGKGY